jgi:hypothetical protein
VPSGSNCENAGMLLRRLIRLQGLLNGLPAQRGARQVFAHTHLVRACVKSLKNTPNFSWGIFSVSLRRSSRSLLVLISLFPRDARGKE